MVIVPHTTVSHVYCGMHLLMCFIDPDDMPLMALDGECDPIYREPEYHRYVFTRKVDEGFLYVHEGRCDRNATLLDKGH